MQAHELSLEEHGAQLLPALAVPLLDRLAAIAARMPADRPGTRIVSDAATAELLDAGGAIGTAIAKLVGERRRPVRAVLFDKSDRTNWSLAWHQDRTIAVKERKDVPGFGPWTMKQGVVHAQPPFEIIGRMVTVRIHLDPVDAHNAPLIVALGSHRRGRIAKDEVEAVVAGCETFACLAAPGDVWIYTASILHASQAAAPGRRRRVLQVDFSGDELPEGLEWLGMSSGDCGTRQ